MMASMFDAKGWFLDRYTIPVAQPADHFPHLEREHRALGVTPPESVLARRRWYRARLGDFGDAWVLAYDPTYDASLERAVFVIFVGTDSDDGAVEIYDVDGTLLECAILDGESIRWNASAAMSEHFPELET